MEEQDITSYCFKCKKITKMVPKEGAESLEEEVKTTIKNRAVHLRKGRCETCGTNTSVIIKGKK